MTDFAPSRRGITLQVTLIVILAAAASVLGLLASREPIGLRFTIFILAAAIAFLPLPFLGYWLYALTRANYSLDRDQLTLLWGLRKEQIPVSDVEWVRPLTAMAVHPPMPFLRMPGAILGVRKSPDLGLVEFLASDVNSLLLIATAKRVFAISPQDPDGFMQSIQHSIEMGSLSQVTPQSIYLSFAILQAWENSLARYLWLAGLFLNIGLLVWVSVMIPSLGRIPLGFLPSGAPGDLVLGAGLILLPVISLFLYVVSWVTGLLFYRRPDRQPLAFLLWASGALTAVLFLVAVVFITTTTA